MAPIQPTRVSPSTAAIASRSGLPLNVATSARADSMSRQADGTCASALTRISAARSRCGGDVDSNGIACTTMVGRLFCRRRDTRVLDGAYRVDVNRSSVSASYRDDPHFRRRFGHALL